MAKGMSFDEFKSGLESEARIENEKLREKIKEMEESHKETIETYKEEIKTLKQWVYELSNRCFLNTGGALCLFCQVDYCEHRFTESEINAAVEFMDKYKLPRNDKTVQTVYDYLQNLRSKRNQK